MSMGHTYNFFGFSISHTILNLPLSILYLPFMLLIPCTFSPILRHPSLLITLYVISMSVIMLQNRHWGWTIYYYRMRLPLCSRCPPPGTRFTFPAARKKTSLNARDWWKGKGLFFFCGGCVLKLYLKSYTNLRIITCLHWDPKVL